LNLGHVQNSSDLHISEIEKPVASINFDLLEKRQKITKNWLELRSKSLDDPRSHRIPPTLQPWNSDGSVFTAPEREI
jgi:hypothetical protein